MNGLDIVIFELAGKPVLLIDLVSSVLGLTCVFLAGRNSKYNFWVGYLYTTALFLLFWNKNLYASLLLQPISLAINVLGHWRWTHPRENEQSAGDPTALKVSMLSILVAQLLSALKKWDCWMAWLLVNITQIILHLSVGHVFMPIVCGLYLANGLWSLATWVRLYKNNE